MASTAKGATWRAVVLTLFPELFPGPLTASLAGEALKRRSWSLDTVALRDFGIGRHRAVDDTPAGGGAGMVMRADVLATAIDEARARHGELAAICLTPRGEPFTQAMARELAAGPGALLLAGRFEGIDQRVIEGRQLREVSIGDYVLSGGELAAMVVIEAGLLEYPQYTRPREWEGHPIPDVLLSGDHARITAWRRAEAERLTRERRPDLRARRQKRN